MLPYDSISRSIVARHFTTDLAQAITVDIGSTVATAVARLKPRSYDHAPVTDGATVVGLVNLAELQSGDEHEPIGFHRLESRYLVSADAPIATLLERLSHSQMVFVVEPTGLAGFVTPADLNKHPARTHFYMLLADLEMTMAAAARRHFDDPDDALTSLSQERRKLVARRHKSDSRHGVDADVLTAFEFADLLTVIKKAGLYRLFGSDTAAKWKSAGWPLSDFRNDVMHPTREFLGARTISDLHEIEASLRRMLFAASAQGFSE